MDRTRILDQLDCKENLLQKALISRSLINQAYQKPQYMMKVVNVLGQILEIIENYCKQSIYSLSDFIAQFYQQKYPQESQHSKQITILFYSFYQQLYVSKELALIDKLFQITMLDSHILLKFYLRLRKQMHKYLRLNRQVHEYFENEILQFDDWTTVIGRVFKNNGILQIGYLVRDYNASSKVLDKHKDSSIGVIPFFRLCINYFNKNRQELLHEQDQYIKSMSQSFASKNRSGSQHYFKSFASSLPLFNDFDIDASTVKQTFNKKSENSTILLIDNQEKKDSYEHDSTNIYRSLNKSSALNNSQLNCSQTKSQGVIMFNKEAEDFYKKNQSQSFSVKFESPTKMIEKTDNISLKYQKLAEFTSSIQNQMKEILEKLLIDRNSVSDEQIKQSLECLDLSKYSKSNIYPILQQFLYQYYFIIKDEKNLINNYAK